MACVSADVASLMVRVDGQIETHQLREGGVVIAEHVREVCRPVLARINAANLEKEREGCGQRVCFKILTNVCRKR